MQKIDRIEINIFKFLYGDLNVSEFEDWLYKTEELKEIIGIDSYQDLVAYNFKSTELKHFLRSLVAKNYFWIEYEIWRTKKLLTDVVEGNIEIVLATRKMRQLYLEQEENITRPLISIELGIGYESVLDNCPAESEYHLWNAEALKKQLEPVDWYKNRILTQAKKELNEINNNVTKTIDLSNIKSIEDLHFYFQGVLGFPDFYGRNWDAFCDSITGLVEMPDCLILKNWNSFETDYPRDGQILSEIIADYNKTLGNKKIIIEEHK